MEVLLIRHGDPDYEADTLTELGNTEARLLAERLTTERVDAIYVSPHKWCMLTLLAYLCHWPLPVMIAHCHLSPTGVTRLTWVEAPNGVAVPKMICMNDLTHLTGMKYNTR